MKKAGIILSLCLNAFLIVGIAVTHIYDTKECDSTEKTNNNSASTMHVICEKEAPSKGTTSDISKARSRVVIDYDEDHTVTRVRTGMVYEYVNQEAYEAVLKENTATEDLGDNKVFFYSEGSSKFVDETGQSFDIWLKTYVEANVKEGYECK